MLDMTFPGIPVNTPSIRRAWTALVGSDPDNPATTTIRASAIENYRPDVDGLRAFAVLSVVLYHAFPEVMRGGYVGVDIFFVISGFLITSILFTEITEHRFSLATFYGRRIRRIFPALAVCLASVLAYGFVSLMPFELEQLGKHVFFGASFLSNIALWSESGYFDGAASLKPLLHLWSLGVEEQFYILWPVLVWMAFQTKAAIGRVLAVLFLSSFAINIVLSETSISDDFYLPVSRFWELLAGAALTWRHEIVLSAHVRSWISLAGLGALLSSVALFTPEMRFPGWPALLPVAGAMGVILAGPYALVNRTVISSRPAVFVGLISYPLYLWHWPLISYAYVIRMGKPPTNLMAAALVIASFVLAWATYRFVEYPVRFGVQRHRRTQIVAVCVAALGACGLGVWNDRGVSERFPANLNIQKINAARFDVTYQPTEDMEVLAYNTCSASDGCSLGFRRKYALVSHLGHGARKVALAGDSLLLHYGPRVQQLADEGRLAASTFFVTGPYCAPVPGIIQQDEFVDCANVPSNLFELVRRQQVQSVVLGAAWAGYGSKKAQVERENRRFNLNTAEGEDAFYANLEDYVRMLQGLGAKVYLVLGVPGSKPRFNPSQMVTRGVTGFRIDPDFDKPESIAGMRAIHTTVDSKLRTIAQRTGATPLDLFPDVCGTGQDCSPLFGAGEPKFTDGMHLRPIFVRENLRFLGFLLT
jgi:peptidoglycan/LPS O-acetylase OafA/YrhL